MLTALPTVQFMIIYTIFVLNSLKSCKYRSRHQYFSLSIRVLKYSPLDTVEMDCPQILNFLKLIIYGCSNKKFAFVREAHFWLIMLKKKREKKKLKARIFIDDTMLYKLHAQTCCKKDWDKQSPQGSSLSNVKGSCS